MKVYFNYVKICVVVIIIIVIRGQAVNVLGCLTAAVRSLQLHSLATAIGAFAADKIDKQQPRTVTVQTRETENATEQELANLMKIYHIY